MIHKNLQKRLIKIGLIFAATTILMIIIDQFIHTQIDGANDDLNRTNAQVQDMKTKFSGILEEQKIHKEAVAFFNGYRDSESAFPGNFTREKSKSNLAKMRQKFGLSSLQLNNNGFREVKNPASNDRAIVVATNSTLRYTSSYDIPVFDLLAALEDSLPGVVSINYFTMKRQGNVTPDVISAVTSGQERGLVVGDVSFNWFGVIDPTIKSGGSIDDTNENQRRVDELQDLFKAMSDVNLEQGADDASTAAPAPTTAPENTSTPAPSPTAPAQAPSTAPAPTGSPATPAPAKPAATPASATPPAPPVPVKPKEAQ